MKHIAVIMDGNRRWAKKNSLMPWKGHKQGIETVKAFIKFCLDKKIQHASLYTFSLENFKRSPQEIGYLFNLIVKSSEDFLPQFIESGIRIRFCGDKSHFPDSVKPTIQKLENQTKNLDKLLLNIIFCYGGKQEIVSAVKNIALAVKDGIIDPDTIDELMLEKHLWSAGIPDPDMIIRTGGQIRLSNFLLFKSAYSELFFTKKLWPELVKEDFENALEDFYFRKRNIGA